MWSDLSTHSDWSNQQSLMALVTELKFSGLGENLDQYVYPPENLHTIIVYVWLRHPRKDCASIKPEQAYQVETANVGKVFIIATRSIGYH